MDRSTSISNLLPFLQKFAYSVGHAINDLASAVFWSYLLIYIQVVIKLEPKYGGYMILITQTADAIGQFTVVLLSNRCRGIWILSKYKSWYFVGTSFITVGILLTYIVIIDAESDLVRFFYVLPMQIGYGVGAGITLVSHLSIMTKISSSTYERVQLNSWRVAVQVICNLMTYIGAWIFLYAGETPNDSSQLSADDGSTFANLAIFCMASGQLCSIFFLIILNEEPKQKSYIATNDSNSNKCKCTNIVHKGTLDPKQDSSVAGRSKNKSTCQVIEIYSVSATALSERVTNNNIHNNLEPDRNTSTEEQKQIASPDINSTSAWLKFALKNVHFYVATIVFISVRLAITSSTLYMPLYTTQSLGMDKISIAILPLLTYTSGFITSLLMKKVNQKLGRKKTFIIGGIITLGAFVWTYFITQDSYRQIYGAFVMFGAGQATTQVSALSMITDFIGNDSEYGAQAFGIVGCVEKAVQGICIVTLQNVNPCGQTESRGCVMFYRNVMVAIPGVSILVAFVALFVQKLLNRKT